MKENYFILSKDCIIVSGYIRSVIYDLTRRDYHFIPNSLSEIIKNKIVDVSIELENISDSLKTIFIENVNFLDELDLLVWDSEKENLECFQDISFSYDSPNKITNLIFEESPENRLTEKVLSQLNEIDCQHIEIRCFNVESLKAIPGFFYNSRILSIDIVTNSSTLSESESEVEDFLFSEPRIRKIIIFESNQLNHTNFRQTGADIISIPKLFQSDNSDCGTICNSHFSIDISLVSESMNCNTCLNKKMSIGVNGEVKNCPSMPDIYGNVKNDSLLEITQNEAFKKYWNIKKDEIQVCKDCEFRHMCSDCRAYRDSDNIYSHPSKCNYNPYIAKWSDETGYITLEDIGVSNDENGFSIDHEKLKLINAEIWR